MGRLKFLVVVGIAMFLAFLGNAVAVFMHPEHGAPCALLAALLYTEMRDIRDELKSLLETT